MSILTSEMIQPSIEFFETELDCSGDASHAITLEFTDDGLNNAEMALLKERSEARMRTQKRDQADDYRPTGGKTARQTTTC